MTKKTLFSFALALLLISFLPAQNLLIINNGFEKNENNKPSNWELSAEGNAVIDNSIKNTGGSSLLFENTDWQSTSASSEIVDLKVGHIYKLSAMVKSENAYTEAIKRYPTSVAGCLTMESMPFTNHTQTVGATNDWHKIETYFVATKSKDKIMLHLGYNGNAKGKVWFDDVELTKVEDIAEYIPLETVKWFDEAYRYDDRGWIFVHIEGDPYERGYQYGYLLAKEIETMMDKLAYMENQDKPRDGWNHMRYATDALMLRKYDVEYLEEMQGIADGAAKAGAKLFNNKLDLLDVVTLNSHIDIDYAAGALRNTAHPLTGRSFLAQEEELNIDERTHKCSGFLANKTATTDGRIVFGQIFMWGGYTGPHWNVITDIVPTKGNRLVYQTYPGGIHSGADFYMNSSGIMIGETTVSQTPFNSDGTPMSNRIRKAAQYANSIDDVEKILFEKNNGMYTNDWLVGDTKTDEIGIFLLGTKEKKLWRSSNNEFYGDSKDWYWSNNNNKSMDVRKESIHNRDNAPYDLTFGPWNRDIAFQEFYKNNYGKIDAVAGVNLWNSSPINRPHACDGKITTSEMAENLVFFAHYGKVTLREKFVGENRRIPDWPNAIPRLTLGYSVASPVYITAKLKEARPKYVAEKCEKTKQDISEIKETLTFDEKLLWHNTVFPSSNKENWFISSTSAYWRMLNRLPENSEKAQIYFYEQLSELNARYNYIAAREGSMKPLEAETVYHQYKHYQMPRIKGTFLLHQLRLKLGGEMFSKVMNKVHTKYFEKEMTTADFVDVLEDVTGEDLESFVMQWLDREGLPQFEITASTEQAEGKYKILLNVKQTGELYSLVTTVMIKTGGQEIIKPVKLDAVENSFSFEVGEKPERIILNYNNDFPVKNDDYFTWSNFFDDFHHTKIVYGTSRQIEANHTLALRFQKVLADRFTETLVPVEKESEVCETGIKTNDLIVLNGTEDNALMKTILDHYKIKAGKNYFEWKGKLYNNSDDGLFLALPNPFAADKAVYLFLCNSALQLYEMTKTHNYMPSWAIFKGDKIVDKGYHNNYDLTVKFK